MPNWKKIRQLCSWSRFDTFDPRPSCKYSRKFLSSVSREPTSIRSSLLFTHSKILMFRSQLPIKVRGFCNDQLDSGEYRVHTRSSTRFALITIWVVEFITLCAFNFFLDVVFSLKSFRMMVLILDDANTTCILTHFDYFIRWKFSSVVIPELQITFLL